MRLHLTKKQLVILSGLGIRFALAPVTGHAYDMGVFAFAQRIYFENGIVGLKTFPTLPPIYFVQLLFYAPYAVLESLGLHDYQLLYHTSFMIEAVFLKTPYILADIAIFVVIQRITGRLLPATLFFFNPLTIYESSVWGIYDPLMLLAVVLGLLLLKRNSVLMSSLAFSVAGALKLFGFLPLVFVLLKNLITRRFHTFGLQFLLGTLVIGGVVAPIVLVGGFYLFLTGFVLRFIGLSGVSSGTVNYSIVYLLLSGQVKYVPYPTLLILVVVSLFYALESRKGSSLTVLAKWSLIGAILLNIFSQAEPQWVAWTIPLAIIYGSLTGRTGLQFYTYVYGTASVFLQDTQSQHGGFEILGTKTFDLPFIMGYTNVLFVYGMTTFVLLLLMLVYVFQRPVKFKLEIIAFVILAYLQAYFWLSIVNVPRILGLT